MISLVSVYRIVVGGLLVLRGVSRSVKINRSSMDRPRKKKAYIAIGCGMLGMVAFALSGFLPFWISIVVKSMGFALSYVELYYIVADGLILPMW